MGLEIGEHVRMSTIICNVEVVGGRSAREAMHQRRCERCMKSLARRSFTRAGRRRVNNFISLQRNNLHKRKQKKNAYDNFEALTMIKNE